MTGERSAPTQETISFGPFELSSGERILRRAGLEVPLGGRALDILTYLVGRSGEVVTKKELIDHAWPDVIVEGGSLRVHMAALRKALGDGQFGNRYITSIKGRGYCFVAPVSRLSAVSRSVDDGSISKKGPAFPPRLSRMIGREVAVDTISAQLATGRFVTIVGTGGIGKTTIAISIGRRLLEGFGNLVHFIDLGSLKDPLLVASATGEALGLPINERDPVPSLIAALRHRRMLLVFDSCEHVIETASVLAERIFNEAPQVHILATSREALSVEGEQVHRLAPLECPLGAHPTAEEALAFSAVRLFVERATANQARFALSDTDAPVVAEICRKLDGIALAIEFAAGRVSAYGIRGVATLLDQRLGLLWAGRRTALPRHRTLTATLDWSYDLLQELERTILRRLSVFAGNFTLEAARSVAAGDGLDDGLVVSAMDGLVTKSLVAADTSDAITHFRLLDTTRAYASRKLVESSEADRISHRHADYYRVLLNRTGTETPGSCAKLDRTGRVTEAWIGTQDRIIDEVRTALDWAYGDRGDLTLAVDLTAAATPLWIQHLLIDECRERIEQAITLITEEAVRRDAPRELRLFSALAVAHMESTADASKIDGAWSRVADLAEELDDSENRLKGLWGLWIGRYFKGDYQGALRIATRFATLPDGAVEAADRFVGERILALTLHILGDQTRARLHIENMLRGYVAPPGQTHILRYHFDQGVAARAFYAQILWLLGFPDQAMAVGNRALDDAMKLGHDFSMLYVLVYGVCPVALERWDFDVAEGLVSRLLQRSETFRPLRVWGQCYAGVLGIRRGDTASGLSLLRDGLKGFAKSNFQHRYVFFLGNLALGLSNAGDHCGALAAIDDALNQSERNDDRWYVAELMRIKGELILRQNQPEAAASAEALFNRSLDWSRKQNALSWELRTAISFARLLEQQGRGSEARALLEQIYFRFTEGFATKDLVDARSLLTSLGVTFAV